MNAANEILINETVWTALNTLLLTRQNPNIERCYTILLFQIGSGERIDISSLFGSRGDLLDADVQEFLRLVEQL